ncbi:MAG: hypothetical protein AAF198_06260 [Pseudomonadota bacterium]
MATESERVKNLIAATEKKARDKAFKEGFEQGEAIGHEKGYRGGYTAKSSEPINVLKPSVNLDTAPVVALTDTIHDSLLALSKTLTVLSKQNAITDAIDKMTESGTQFPPEFLQGIQVWVQALDKNTSTAAAMITIAEKTLVAAERQATALEKSAVQTKRLADEREQDLRIEYSDGSSATVSSKS